MVSRLKPKAKPWRRENIWFPGATPTRSRNGERHPFKTQCCLCKVRQPEQMFAVTFHIDSSSAETRPLNRNPICMMKNTKTTTRCKLIEWSLKDFNKRLVKKKNKTKKKPNQVSRLSPALGNVFRVSSTTKKKTKKSTKQGPISPLFADADLLCGDTLERTTSDFSSENTDWKRSWMLSDHLAYFQPSSKATTEEEAVTPENGIGYRVFSCYRTRCEIIILSHRCWKKKKQYKAVSTCLFFFKENEMYNFKMTLYLQDLHASSSWSYQAWFIYF